MFLRKFAISAPIFFVIYLLQEAFVSQLRLTGGGFSLFLIFTLIWCALCEPEVGAMVGFGAGLLMDLSQSSSGPMGQWTLIMILAGFAIAYLGFGDNNFRSSPISLIALTVIGVFLARSVYFIVGVMLGNQAGSMQHVVVSLIGQSLWAVAVTPLLVPVITKIHGLVYGSGAHL
jgi:rod shape-determining protein MreD